LIQFIENSYELKVLYCIDTLILEVSYAIQKFFLYFY